MSTLSEIAMNHARMVKGLAEQTIELEARQPVVVGSFDASTLEPTPHMPLHFLMDVPDRSVELLGAAV